MKQAILLAAYGAGGVQGTHTLQPFERTVRRAFPEASIRWAFTSMIMRTRLAAARKKTDSITKALCRLGFEKYTHVTVQPLHMIAGREYEALLDEIRAAAACGAPGNIRTGAPLLHSREDIELAARAIVQSRPEERGPDEAVVWVGHGTLHEGGEAYARLTKAVQRLDANTFIGTLEGEEQGPSGVLPLLAERGLKSAWLMPLLSVVGKHAGEDIAGDKPGSWRGALEGAGISCRAVLRGAIEYPGIAGIWMRHLEKAACNNA